MASDDPRIEALEMRLAEQQRVIDDLDAAVTAQWDALDALKRQLVRALDRIAEAEGRLPPDPEGPPPHH